MTETIIILAGLVSFFGFMWQSYYWENVYLRKKLAWTEEKLGIYQETLNDVQNTRFPS